MTAQPLRHEYEPKATFTIKSWDQERADRLIQVLDEWICMNEKNRIKDNA